VVPQAVARAVAAAWVGLELCSATLRVVTRREALRALTLGGAPPACTTLPRHSPFGWRNRVLFASRLCCWTLGCGSQASQRNCLRTSLRHSGRNIRAAAAQSSPRVALAPQAHRPEAALRLGELRAPAQKCSEWGLRPLDEDVALQRLARMVLMVALQVAAWPVVGLWLGGSRRARSSFPRSSAGGWRSTGPFIGAAIPGRPTFPPLLFLPVSLVRQTASRAVPFWRREAAEASCGSGSREKWREMKWLETKWRETKWREALW